MSTTETRELIDQALALPDWYHSIELAPSVRTPGRWSAADQQHIRHALDTVDFSGAQVLDVGCLDGCWSFEAESRGASAVYATDKVSLSYGSEREEYFRRAAAALGSGAHYHPDLSVFDIAELGIRDFDVVLFLGVYYHLKDPLLALARLRQVMRHDAVIVVEGQAIVDDASYARFFFNRTLGGDPSNWWVPTTVCLDEWVECSFFDLERSWTSSGPISWGGLEHTTRYVRTARAVRRRDPRLCARDEELADFDDNDYP